MFRGLGGKVGGVHLGEEWAGGQRWREGAECMWEGGREGGDGRLRGAEEA